jgi:hypothetical protein
MDCPRLPDPDDSIGIEWIPVKEGQLLHFPAIGGFQIEQDDVRNFFLSNNSDKLC